MHRRQFGGLLARLAAVGLLLTAPAVRAQSRRPKKTVNLREQLEYGLRARRAQEFAFIVLVVHMVDDGELPLAMVQSTFDWARYKRPYPMVYFERALRIRANRAGIQIPQVRGGN